MTKKKSQYDYNSRIKRKTRKFIEAETEDPVLALMICTFVVIWSVFKIITFGIDNN